MPTVRINLDGIPLSDGSDEALCTFRFRTASGIIVSVPLEGDVTIPWAELREVVADLFSGQLRVSLSPLALARCPWLGGSLELSGSWLDRRVLTGAPDAS